MFASPVPLWIADRRVRRRKRCESTGQNLTLGNQARIELETDIGLETHLANHLDVGVGRSVGDPVENVVDRLEIVLRSPAGV